jgi:hypothetical protein
LSSRGTAFVAASGETVSESLESAGAKSLKMSGIPIGGSFSSTGIEMPIGIGRKGARLLTWKRTDTYHLSISAELWAA